MSAVKRVAKSLSRLDHRSVGNRQNLFFFDEASTGSCFFKPRGAHIYNKLISYLRKEYKQRNYEEVITPNIYDRRLWETSGHWDHYKNNMIGFQLGESNYGLKPMNCPSHCLMFKYDGIKNSSELPVRWADFGVLHRNEQSGCLLGLSRVRRFQQDDAHIFCTPDQIESEVEGCLQFAKEVYTKFGFTFDMELSLRPESYLGSSEIWDKAENSLRKALEGAKVIWHERKAEGAFYGPKIDMVVNDNLNRRFQCATIQLDFQLPDRFELVYKNLESKSLERPVIIHRAILGSIERFIAMFAENCGGRWPFWLSPLQAKVIPVHTNFNSEAKRVNTELRRSGFLTDCDLGESTLNFKIREAAMLPYNLILIVGPRESVSNSVNCRITSSTHLSDTDCDSSTGKGKLSVHNINITLPEFVNHLKEFNERQVDRADLELLRLISDKNRS